MREDVENRPPSPSLPQLPHSTSPSIPPHHASPSATRLSSEDGAIDEEIAITLDTRETLFPEGKDLQHPEREAAPQHCVWHTVLHLCVSVFQCLCSGTGNLSISLLLKALHLNSVTPPLAKSPYLLSQSETTARRDRFDIHTCSGLLNQTVQQILGQTVSMTTATRTTTFITWASTSAWRSCRHFIPPRRTASLPGCSWRPTHTPHTPQTETTWVA